MVNQISSGNGRSKLKKQTLKCFLTAFFLDTGLGMFLVIMPQFAMDDFNADARMLGMLGFVHTFCYATGCLVFGTRADQWPRVRMLKVGVCGATAAMILFGLASELWLLYAALIISGLSLGALWPTLQSILTEGHNRKALMGIITVYAISWNSGFMVGMVLGGILYGLGTGKGPMEFAILARWLPAIIFLLTGAVMFLVQWDDTRLGTVHPDMNETPKANRTRFIYAAWITNFTILFTFGVVGSIYPKLAREIHVHAALFGVMLGIGRMIQVALFPVLYYFQQWHYRKRYFFFCLLAAAVSVMILATAESQAAVWVGMILLSVAAGFAYMSSTFYAIFGAPNRGKNLGIHEALIGGGAFFGPLVIGQVAAWCEAGRRIPGFLAHKSAAILRGPYVFLAGVVLLAIVVMAFSFSRNAQSDTPEQGSVKE